MRLSSHTLGQLPSDVALPAYDRTAVKRGVVHLGIGAFHRAHQAAVFNAALASGDPRWGVTGVSLRSAGVRDQLELQDGLYTLLVRSGAGSQARVIGSVLDVLVAPEDPRRVVDAIAAADTHLVTLTITEKGYKLDRATGGLLADDADIAHDMASLEAPRTAPGLIVAGLKLRRTVGLPALTIMSCDNLPHNGALLRDAVIAMARAHDAGLADWIAAEAAFPSTMVDRIVPATTDDDIAARRELTGIEDLAMVKTEPFTQWVIEDWFCGPRPDFAALGVQLTDKVAPWEDAKLRLLNGAHSAIAYLGGLGGDEFVHQFVARDAGRAMIETLWDEAQTTLDPPAGLDIPAYRAALLERFANPALQHRTRQIAMDGSQKLPQRLIAPLAERAAAGQQSPALVLAVAAWMRWQAGRTDDGTAFEIDDPAAARLADASGVDGYLAVLGAELDARTYAAIAAQLTRLEQSGALAALEHTHGDHP
ncbi:mannitol dehydrogenase family protein [Blastomonas sp.]|uniref:mannitol dehydrogenase family protein n=1 Tax=Blastomonas sp. TaxID=1909299 RepID=UPI00260324BC|nr:mannitol dehydrogenase family protein [Blastomonas sp.]MDM7955196.1 mannitol dehydrogenase family protein [Blastomonas sp.]